MSNCGIIGNKEQCMMMVRITVNVLLTTSFVIADTTDENKDL